MHVFRVQPFPHCLHVIYAYWVEFQTHTVGINKSLKFLIKMIAKSWFQLSSVPVDCQLSLGFFLKLGELCEDKGDFGRGWKTSSILKMDSDRKYLKAPSPKGRSVVTTSLHNRMLLHAPTGTQLPLSWGLLCADIDTYFIFSAQHTNTVSYSTLCYSFSGDT